MNSVSRISQNVRIIAIESMKLFDDRDYWRIQITSMAEMEQYVLYVLLHCLVFMKINS